MIGEQIHIKLRIASIPVVQALHQIITRLQNVLFQLTAIRSQEAHDRRTDSQLEINLELKKKKCKLKTVRPLACQTGSAIYQANYSAAGLIKLIVLDIFSLFLKCTALQTNLFLLMIGPNYKYLFQRRAGSSEIYRRLQFHFNICQDATDDDDATFCHSYTEVNQKDQVYLLEGQLNQSLLHERKMNEITRTRIETTRTEIKTIIIKENNHNFVIFKN